MYDRELRCPGCTYPTTTRILKNKIEKYREECEKNGENPTQKGFWDWHGSPGFFTRIWEYNIVQVHQELEKMEKE